MKKKALFGTLLGGGVASVLLIFWVVTAHSQILPKLPPKATIPAIAGAKLEAAIKAADCNAAYREYQEIDRRYQEKLGICNQMDREQRKRDEESAIQLRLIAMKNDSEISPDGEDWQRRCRAFIGRYERESQSAEDLASTNFSTYWNSCYFEADSLTSLEAARREIEDVVCEKCGNRWPGPDTLYSHCHILIVAKTWLTWVESNKKV